MVGEKNKMIGVSVRIVINDIRCLPKIHYYDIRRW